jgi:hypothetical protein
VDLNRNFPTKDWEKDAVNYWKKETKSNPRRFPGEKSGSEPETQCALKHIEDFKPDFIVSIHTPLKVLDYDGPKVRPPKFDYLPWKNLGHFPGSLGRYMWFERKVPVLTMEMKEDLPSSTTPLMQLQDIIGFLVSLDLSPKESIKTNYENNYKYDVNENNKQQKNKKEIELKLLTTMCDRLGGDKGIVNNTLDKYILPHLQERVNNILTELGEYEIVIKRNGDMGLDIFKYTNDGMLEMDTMSGCENILANIAFRSAMNELNTNMKCDVLIIDEGFQYCDDKTIEKISMYFDYVRNNYKCAIVISHDERIKKMYDSVYTIIQNKDKDSALVMQ